MKNQHHISPSYPTKFIALFGMCTAMVFVSSCGWQLRGSGGLEKTHLLSEISLSISADASSEKLAQQIKRSTLRTDKHANAPTNTLQLTLHRVTTSRRPTAYGATGLAVQYQLDMGSDYSVQNQQGEQLIAHEHANSRRQYDYDPELILAKEREQADLESEMRRDLSQQILRRIAQVIAQPNDVERQPPPQ